MRLQVANRAATGVVHEANLNSLVAATVVLAGTTLTVGTGSSEVPSSAGPASAALLLGDG